MLKYKLFLSQTNKSRAYLPYLKILFEYLDSHNLRLEDLTYEQFLGFVSERDYKPETKNLYLKAIKSYAKFSNLSSPFLDKLKSKEIGFFKTHRELKDYPTYEEIKAIYPQLTEKEKAVIEFFIASGARKNEFLQMKRIDIDLNRRVAKLLHCKGGKPRYVAFSQSVADEIKELFIKEPEITNAFNFGAGCLRGLCRKIAKGLQREVKIHALRHIAARNMFSRGLDVVSVSHILGHSSIKTTTEVYLAETDEKVINKYHSVMG